MSRLPPLPEWLRTRTSSADLIRLGSSLVLALLLWGWVTAREDPETTRPFSGVTVEVGALPENLIVVSAPPNVVVRLTGPESVIEDIQPAEVTARLDLDDIDEVGAYNVDVIVTAPNGVWRREAIPGNIPIQVEESVAKQFSVVPEIAGEVGPNRRVGTIVPEFSDVTVRGPSSVVSRVAGVFLPIEITTQARDFTSSVTPVARDENGQAVTDVEISPNPITVNVPIQAAGKSIAVLTEIIGTPAEGLEVLDRVVNPSSVTIDGPQEALNSLVNVDTPPIDITGATGNISRRVGLENLPDGVRVIDPPDGRVEVLIQIGQRGIRQELPGQRVDVVNLDPAYVASVEPGDVTVVVVASSESLAGLTANDLVIQVDAAGLGPGEHRLKPIISLPPNVQWINTTPEDVLVTIQAAPGTPSPLAADPILQPPGSPSPEP